MRQSSRLDRAVALTLRISAYSAFGLAALGLALQFFALAVAPIMLRAAVILLLLTPALRLAVIAVLFLRERDRKYALIALVVLAIVIGSSVIGMRVR